MIHRVEVAYTAAEYKSKIEHIQRELWTVQMVQFLNNTWVITATAEDETKTLALAEIKNGANDQPRKDNS